MTAKGINLIWKTTQESNFSYFGVESSLDAKTWKESSQVKGTKAGSYSATVQPRGALTYLRLKLVDRDSSVQYSRIIGVKSTTVVPVKPGRNVLPPKVYQSPVRAVGPRGGS
jgi:hypothetical protein